MVKPRKILLVAITRMGDMLQASPMIHALKKDNPNTQITLASEKQFASICEGIPGIDNVYVIDLGMVYRSLIRDQHNIVDAYSYVDKVVRDLRDEQFDICVNLASSGYTALLLRLLDIEDSRGWVSDEEGYRIITNPWSMLFAAFVYHANRDFNSINIVDIFRACSGVQSNPGKLMYEPSQQDRESGQRFLTEHGIAEGGPLIAIQAGASQDKRQWPPAKFARVAQHLVEDCNARLLFTGSSSESEIIEAVFQHYNSPKMINAAGKTSLGDLAALLETSDLLITGDTGPMHLSVAVGTPVVALFLASALCYETGPYGLGHIVVAPEIACCPCNPNHPCVLPDCHEQITPELIAYLVRERLGMMAEQVETMFVPASVAKPSSVGVYASVFDEESFLDFKRINEYAPRKGKPHEFYKATRDSYRVLWKEEFGIVERVSVWNNIVHTELHTELSKEALLPGMVELGQLAEHGQAKVEVLKNLIVDTNQPPQLLGETQLQIEGIDRAIEEIGLSSSVLAPITRMFIMEKQNIRGNDPVQIANDHQDLYKRLIRRCHKFKSLFIYYYYLPTKITLNPSKECCSIETVI